MSDCYEIQLPSIPNGANLQLADPSLINYYSDLENRIYWLNDEMEELNFNTITEETSFYVNENGNIVIGFDEGEVAPMYMGAVEFEIPSAVLIDIRK